MSTPELSNQWQDIIRNLVSGHCSNNIRSLLQRMGLATIVYYIRKEINALIVTQDRRIDEDPIKTITESVRMQLMNIKVKQTLLVAKIAKEWLVDMNYAKIAKLHWVAV